MRPRAYLSPRGGDRVSLTASYLPVGLGRAKARPFFGLSLRCGTNGRVTLRFGAKPGGAGSGAPGWHRPFDHIFSRIGPARHVMHRWRPGWLETIRTNLTCCARPAATGCERPRHAGTTSCQRVARVLPSATAVPFTLSVQDTVTELDPGIFACGPFFAPTSGGKHDRGDGRDRWRARHRNRNRRSLGPSDDFEPGYVHWRVRPQVRIL